MAPVIDIGKYLLPASKRRPVANMQSTKENVSCETNPSKQAVSIPAAAAKMDKATGMDERCFRPVLCTVKAELGRGQPGLRRWIWDETLPQSSTDRSTFYSAAHCATKWASGRPLKATGNVVSATDSWRTPAENMEQSEIRSSIVLIHKISNWYQRGGSRWRSYLRAPGQGKFQLWRFKQNLKQIPQCTQEDTMEIKAFLDCLQSMIDNIYQKDEIEDSVDKVKSQDIPKGATQQGSFMKMDNSLMVYTVYDTRSPTGRYHKQHRNR